MEDRKIITFVILISLALWSILIVTLVNTCGVYVPQSKNSHIQDTLLVVSEPSDSLQNAFVPSGRSETVLHQEKHRFKYSNPHNPCIVQPAQKDRSQSGSPIFSPPYRQPKFINLYPNKPKVLSQNELDLLNKFSLIDLKTLNKLGENKSGQDNIPLDLYRVTDRKVIP